MDLTLESGGATHPFTNDTSPYLHYLKDHPLGPVPSPTAVNKMKTAARKLYRLATNETTMPAWYNAMLDGIGLAMMPAARISAPATYSEDPETDPATAYLSPGATPEKAVIVGVIDDVVPFAHERLTVGGTDARVASVWMPDVAPETSSGVGADLPFGREWRGGQITGLLGDLRAGALADEEALYRQAGAVNFATGPSQRVAGASSHGAGVIGLAAGMAANDPEAASFPVIAAVLPRRVSADTLGTLAPLHIALAALFILHRARRVAAHLNAAAGPSSEPIKPPVVLNLSYGVTAGPKDGFGAVDRLVQMLSDLTLPDLGPITVVLPMGNHRLARLSGVYTADGSDTAQWMLRPDDETPSVLEVWGPRRADETPPATRMKLKIKPQGATKWTTTTLKSHGTWQSVMRDGKEIARAYLQYAVNDGGGREVLSLFTPPTRPEATTNRYGLPGRWEVAVQADGQEPVTLRVQRDDALPGFGPRRGRQSVLLDADPVYEDDGRIKEHDTQTAGVLRAGTINPYATADAAVRVGGTFGLYEDETGKRPPRIVPYSSLGFDDPGRPIEGDRLAPSEYSENLRGVPSIGTKSGSARRYAGTSFSAPQITRQIAVSLL